LLSVNKVTKLNTHCHKPLRDIHQADGGIAKVTRMAVDWFTDTFTTPMPLMPNDMSSNSDQQQQQQQQQQQPAEKKQKVMVSRHIVACKSCRTGIL
jgi:hypothetical protein